MATVAAFLPCRAGSKRVPKKNVRPFAGFEGGLIEVKLRQLLTSRVDNVVVSSDDEEVLQRAQDLDDGRFTIHRRSAELSSDATSTDDLVAHAAGLTDCDIILWTHVTSPFIDGDEYDELISRYLALEGSHDSLMTVTAVRTFVWNSRGPINYDRSVEKWPRTQTIEPVYQINNAAFIAPRETYLDAADRIGSRPVLHPLGHLSAVDIDWPEDFAVAELLAKSCLDVTGRRRPLQPGFL